MGERKESKKKKAIQDVDDYFLILNRYRQI